MKKNRAFNLKERREIERLCADSSLSLTAIAAMIGRSKNGVVSEVRNNGGRENYNAFEAQTAAIARNEERYQALSERNKLQKKGSQNNSARIDIIEMQLEIIIEQLNKLMGKS